MVKSKVIAIASIVTCCLLQAHGADKYTDENRPYEFGFSIDGEQHRHEKKDENGLIMGEFGFITADGVYHVTVYATDEQGRFKILSMKNIRVKPYPTYTGKASGSSSRQGHSLELPSSQAPPITTVSSTEYPVKQISLEPPGRSCSSCSLPTTSTAAPVIPPVNLNNPKQNSNGFSRTADKTQSDFVNQQTAINSPFPRQPSKELPAISQRNNFNNPSVKSQSVDSSSSEPALGNGVSFKSNGINPVQSPPERELVPPQPNNPTQPQNNLGSSQTTFEKNTPQIADNLSPQISQIGSDSPAAVPQGPFNTPHSVGNPINPAFTSQTQNPASITQEGSKEPQGIAQPLNVPGGRSPKRLDSDQQFEPVGPQPNSVLRGSLNSANVNPEAPNKPTLISAQMQIVDKNTDIYNLGPGEQKGLPKGLTKDDMTHLLYTFNYTVGFHGHFEEGYTNGVKQGYYFVTGRNGVRTRIDYVADSEGFHPKISQEVLDLLSDDVPKPETEREEKYGLKGYEFKWLYYPTETKAR